MRKSILIATGALALGGCYHTTVTDLPDNQRLVTFVNDARPLFANTSVILGEDVALWRASHVCPGGFKVAQENIDLGSYPQAYSIVIKCHDVVGLVPVSPVPATVQ